ncbi:MAG: methyltransferase domain-containing protein [Actinobacteria bacterium]|nr:MAG: methyltransferase domain-containing protein [Actinomycetota bacterium]
MPFYRAVAEATLEHARRCRLPIEGCRWLDVGAGIGAMAEALAGAGATVVALDVEDGWGPGVTRTPFVMGRGERLPFRDGAFDAVLCSNVLEHVPDPMTIVLELARTCRPGGAIYVSWTNWLSPWGGHEMSPFHYLGPRAGTRVYRALHGREPANLPGRTLFVVHVGETLRRLRASGLKVRQVAPRYWPSLGFVARVPGLREIAMWNCAVVVQRPAGWEPPQRSG